MFLLDKNQELSFATKKLCLMVLEGILMLLALSFLKYNKSVNRRSVLFPVSIGITDSSRQKEKEETVDTLKYNKMLLNLVGNKPLAGWPVYTDYPLAGAILPFNRVVAYYGNFYAKGMGILGELAPDEMLDRLRIECRNWKQADSSMPILPALHYIAVTAQDQAGSDGKYRLRMPFREIDKTISLARQVNGIVILDIQVGLSSLEEELPLLLPYLRLPDVHLGIDPEYSMKGGQVPCTVIGTFDAADINYASAYLSDIVRRYHLPPKILVIHRFTREMVTNYKQIVTCPEVQFVMNMDGFGIPAKKIDSYKRVIVREPVQFAGFKLFYKIDTDNAHKNIMQPRDVLELFPRPVYIQYQ